MAAAAHNIEYRFIKIIFLELYTQSDAIGAEHGIGALIVDAHRVIDHIAIDHRGQTAIAGDGG